MKIEEIKELIRLVNETGIAELEVQRSEDRVRIRRSIAGSDQQVVVPAVVPMSVTTSPSLAVMSPPAALSSPEAPAPAMPERAEERTMTVKSPIVGTYYDSPSPGAAPFVKIGDIVQPKQVLCIIESMKLMNEIESEFAGTVVAKLVENGRPVEYGEALFTIRPS